MANNENKSEKQNLFVRFFGTLGRWFGRMFMGASKSLATEDALAVEALESPSRMAVRTFFRRKLAVTAVQMNNLLDKNLRNRLSPDVCEAQDTLALMLLLQGMPYADLAHLHKGNLNGDLLICRRRKTGTELCVRLLPEKDFTATDKIGNSCQSILVNVGSSKPLFLPQPIHDFVHESCKTFLFHKTIFKELNIHTHHFNKIKGEKTRRKAKRFGKRE